YIGAFDLGISMKPPLLPGSPLKVREYMACGRPVIASEGTGYDFGIVRDAGAGLLVDPSDIQTIAACIEPLLDNEALQREMGARGRDYVLGHCTWSRTAEMVASVCSR